MLAGVKELLVRGVTLQRVFNFVVWAGKFRVSNKFEVVQVWVMVQVRDVPQEMPVIQVLARSLPVSIVWAQFMLLLLHSSLLMLEVLLQDYPLIRLDIHTSRFMALSASIETISAALLTLSIGLVDIIARLLFILHLNNDVILLHVLELLRQSAFLSFDHSCLGFAVTCLGLLILSLNHLITVFTCYEWVGRIAFTWFWGYVLVISLFICAPRSAWCILDIFIKHLSVFGRE